MNKAYYFVGNPIRFYYKKHSCPICGLNLIIIMHHKIINSKSSEMDKYSDLFGDGQIIGNFDCDIRHKIFYCTHCHLEIEQKTLFTYEDMMKKINKILDSAKSNYYVELKYLLDDKSLVSKANNPFQIKKVIANINALGNNHSFIIFDSKNKKIYAEEKYFYKTKEYKKMMKLIKKYK